MFVAANDTGPAEFTIGLKAASANLTGIDGLTIIVDIGPIVDGTTIRMDVDAWRVDAPGGDPDNIYRRASGATPATITVNPFGSTAGSTHGIKGGTNVITSGLLPEAHYWFSTAGSRNPVTLNGSRPGTVRLAAGYSRAVTGTNTTPIPAANYISFTTTWQTLETNEFAITLSAAAFSPAPTVNSDWDDLFAILDGGRTRNFVRLYIDSPITATLYDAPIKAVTRSYSGTQTAVNDMTIFSNSALGSSDVNGIELWGANGGYIRPALLNQMNSGADVEVRVQYVNRTSGANQVRLVGVRNKYNWRPAVDARIAQTAVLNASRGPWELNQANPFSDLARTEGRRVSEAAWRAGVNAGSGTTGTAVIKIDNADIWNSDTQEFMWDAFYIEKWNVVSAPANPAKNNTAAGLFEIVQWSVVAVGGNPGSGGDGGGTNIPANAIFFNKDTVTWADVDVLAGYVK
jgi:hypothetical protein